MVMRSRDQLLPEGDSEPSGNTLFSTIRFIRCARSDDAESFAIRKQRLGQSCFHSTSHCIVRQFASVQLSHRLDERVFPHGRP